MLFWHLWSGQDQRLSWSRLWGIWSCMIREYSTRSPQSGELRLKSLAQALGQKSWIRIRGVGVKRRVLIKEFPATNLDLSQDHSDRRPETWVTTESLEAGVFLQESRTKSHKDKMPYMSTDRNEYQLKMSLVANTFMLYPYTYNIQNVIKKLRRRVSSSSLLVLIISNPNNVWLARCLNWLVNVLVRMTHPDSCRSAQHCTGMANWPNTIQCLGSDDIMSLGIKSSAFLRVEEIGAQKFEVRCLFFEY